MGDIELLFFFRDCIVEGIDRVDGLQIGTHRELLDEAESQIEIYKMLLGKDII